MNAAGPDWVEQARRFAAGLAAGHESGRAAGHESGRDMSDVLGGLLGPPAGGASVEHGAECRWCPLCAGLAALRGRRPDLVEALADVLQSAATALRSTARTSPTGDDAESDPRATQPSAPPEETVPHQAPAPTVQRIEVA